MDTAAVDDGIRAKIPYEDKRLKTVDDEKVSLAEDTDGEVDEEDAEEEEEDADEEEERVSGTDGGAAL